MATLIEDLKAELNGETINQMLNIVRSNRPSFIGSIAGFSTPELMTSDKKHQWLDYKIDARGDVTAAPVADGVATSITVADGSKFRSRQVVRVPSTGEVLAIDSVSGNTLTVIRGVGGTAAAIGSGAELQIQGTAREENSLPDADTIDQPDKRWNYFQTFDTTLQFSDDMMKAYSYGDTNNLQFQLQNQMMQLNYQLNRSMLWNSRNTFTVGGKDSTMAGGIGSFIESASDLNFDNGAATLTLDQINAVYESIFNKGGMVNKICVGTALGRKLNALVSANYSSQRLQTWTSDQGSLTQLPSDLPLFGGVTDIVIDNNMGANELFMYDSSKIQIVPVAANQSMSDGSWVTKDATTPGQDGAALRVIGKLSFRFRDYATHMARIYNVG